MATSKMAGAGIFLVALAVRVAYLVQSASNPTFYVPIVDAAVYHDIAAAWAEGRGMNGLFFWQPFFYPFSLGLIYKLGGVSIVYAKAVQVLVGSLTCVLAWRLGRRLFGEGTGVLAGLICALYGPLIFYDGELLGASWAALWSVFLVLLLMHAADHPGLPMSFCWGACGAIGVLIRPEFIPFVFAGTLWLTVRWHRNRGGIRMLSKALVGAVCGFLIISLPVAAQCRRVTGHFTFLPASSAINLYLGNNPDRCSTMTIRPGWEWRSLESLPLRFGVRDAWGGRRVFYERFIDNVQTRPLDVLRTTGTKLLQFIDSREIPRNTDIYLFRKWSSLLGLLVWKADGFGFPFGLLFPLAVLGAIRHRRSLPLPMALFVASYSLMNIVVFVSGRYRVVLVPALAVLAASGATNLVGIFGGKRWSRAAAGVGLFLALLLVVMVPGPFCEERVDFEAEMHLNLGIQKLAAGEMTIAEEWIDSAVAKKPSWAEARNYLGTVLYSQGKAEEGKQQMLEAIRLNKDFEPAYDTMANALIAEDRDEEALRYVREAIRINPYYPEAHNTLGILMARADDFLSAGREFDRALELKPDYPVAHNNVGKLLVRMGRIEDAVWHFREALRLNPGLQEARENLEAASIRESYGPKGIE